MTRQFTQLARTIFGILIIALSSCVNSKKTAYFNDSALKDSLSLFSPQNIETVIQPNDILSISITSLSQEASAVFNQPNLPSSLVNSSNPNLQQTAGYQVGADSCIQFPLLGTLKVAGQSKVSLAKLIAAELIKRDQLNDPIVKVRILNYRVTVLGEVARPGVINVPSEQISILEAIGAAGDLTIYGKRSNVLLIRQEGDQKKMIRLNLNTTGLIQSPYFYLQSNDVVYVEPGNARIANSSRLQQLLPSILSAASLIVVLITSIR